MNSEIIYKGNDEIKYIQFKRLLDYGIKHAYTLRGENINFSSKSELKDDSYKKICNALEIDSKTIIKPYQTHTSVVKCIDLQVDVENLQNVDGTITDKKNLTLATTNADCILFLLYDPVKNVIGNVHSGWRGTFQKILEKAIVKMINFYKSNPNDVICCICPSIRNCHFEVDEDVKELCEEIFLFTNKTKEFIKKGDLKEGKQKYFIDTVKINKILLNELGVKNENIIDSNLCSVCNSNIISSRRAEGEKFTLATAIITL